MATHLLQNSSPSRKDFGPSPPLNISVLVLIDNNWLLKEHEKLTLFSFSVNTVTVSNLTNQFQIAHAI